MGSKNDRVLWRGAISVPSTGLQLFLSLRDIQLYSPVLTTARGEGLCGKGEKTVTVRKFLFFSELGLLPICCHGLWRCGSMLTFYKYRIYRLVYIDNLTQTYVVFESNIVQTYQKY